MDIPSKTTMQELTEKIKQIEGGADLFDGSFDWKTIDALQLDPLLTGCEVLGAEPIGYPLTDGVIIYLQKPSGERFTLTLHHYPEPFRDGRELNDVEIEITELPRA